MDVFAYSAISSFGLIAVGAGLTARNFMRPRFRSPQEQNPDRADRVADDRC